MDTPRLPLPLRDALAELAIAALEDEGAAAALRWLADPHGEPPVPAAARLVAVHLIDRGGRTLLAVHAPHAAAVAAHASRALQAAAAAGRPRAADPLTRAAQHAIALWNAGLFFEVHEVLEARWRDATGPTRQALQGVIQIAVAFYHLAHGNERGARTLMSEGRERLARAPASALPALDLGALLASTAAWEAALDGDAPPATDLPRLEPGPAR